MQLLAVSLVSDRILPPIPCAQALDVDGSGAARWVFNKHCLFVAWSRANSLHYILMPVLSLPGCTVFLRSFSDVSHSPHRQS